MITRTWATASIYSDADGGAGNGGGRGGGNGGGGGGNGGGGAVGYVGGGGGCGGSGGVVVVVVVVVAQVQRERIDKGLTLISFQISSHWKMTKDSFSHTFSLDAFNCRWWIWGSKTAKYLSNAMIISVNTEVTSATQARTPLVRNLQRTVPEIPSGWLTVCATIERGTRKRATMMSAAARFRIK